jgi:hypothetical protein
MCTTDETAIAIILSHRLSKTGTFNRHTVWAYQVVPAAEFESAPPIMQDYSNAGQIEEISY